MLTRDFFPQLCSIQQATYAPNSSGERVATWADVDGLSEIACKVGNTAGGERRTSNELYLDATNVIILAGYFDNITEIMRAVVDEQAYDILLVNSNSEKAVMRLVTRIVL